jgi:glycosyltransferase involved in cell wall biosynthesis
MRKKRILFLTDYAGAFTGFGKQCKLLLSYLYKTKKYEILNLAQGVRSSAENYEAVDKFPWKTTGTIPDQDEQVKARMMQDPNFARHVSYGALTLNDTVKNFKPDLIFAVNDTWGSQFIIDQPFASKIPYVCWNTFDSLPLLQDTVEKANKIKNYWTWSQFATNEFHKLGFSHVKTQYPLVNTDQFYKLKDLEIESIKSKHGLPKDSFIIGFVFRNQLRKLINTQIEAYSIFKKNQPEIKNTFLYTHTHYGEGWDIPKLCKQYGVNPKEVLCTYVCAETREYFILPFQGQNIKNPKTGVNSLITSNPDIGVTDEQLNEIYNIFSLYSHPATSGACELPCVEAALTEKIITTCAYSFGEDIINYNEGSIRMPFSFYTEHGTHFLKSQPFPSDLAEIFKNVYDLNQEEKEKMGKLSAKWAIENYSININGAKIESFIDSQEILNFDLIDLESTPVLSNPTAQIPNSKSQIEWIKNLYKHILGREVTDNDEGLLHWTEKIKQNVPLRDIENYFRKVAAEEINKNNKVSIEDFLDKDDNGKRLLIIVGGSKVDAFYSTSLLESFKEIYPNYNIYVSSPKENIPIYSGNKFIHKIIPYTEQIEKNIPQLEDSLFEIVIPLTYCYNIAKIHSHNQKDKIALNLTK